MNPKSKIRQSLEALHNGTALTIVASSNLAERAAARMRQDLKENPIDPWYSKDWGHLANQVVGQETKIETD